MERLLEVLARALVDNPEAVQVHQVEKEDAIILQLRVAPEDMGKVIGKQGRVAKAIRTVVKGASGRQGKKVLVEIGQ